MSPTDRTRTRPRHAPSRRRRLLAVAVVLLAVAALGTLAWIGTRSPEPTAWSSRLLPTPPGAPASAPQPGASAPPSGTPRPSVSPIGPDRAATSSLRCKSTPSTCRFPDSTNTGIPRGTKLSAAVSDMTITKPGTYSGLNVQGSLTVKANHVVVRASRIGCAGGACVSLEGTYDTLMDSDVGGGASGHDYTQADYAVYSGGTTRTNLVLRVNMHHANDGMRVDGGTTVQDSYIHDLTSGINGSHSDGSQSCGGSGISFLHNTIWGGNNDPLFLQGGDCGPNDAHPLRDITVNDNLLLCLNLPDNGSSYGISVGRALQVTITNNHFDRGWQVVPVGTFWDNSLAAFSGNVFDDNGTAIAHP